MKAWERSVKNARDNERRRSRMRGYESEGDYLFEKQKQREEEETKTIGDTLKRDPSDIRIFIVKADMPKNEGGGK